MELLKTAATHHAWIEAMGWHGKSNIETLGLILSEVGEATDELSYDTKHSQYLWIKSPMFGEEVIDGVLRMMDFMVTHKVDILGEAAKQLNAGTIRSEISIAELASIASAANLFEGLQHVGLRLLKVQADVARTINDCRKQVLAPDFHKHLVTAFLKFLVLAHDEGVSIELEIRNKMEKNLKNGNKGRLL